MRLLNTSSDVALVQTTWYINEMHKAEITNESTERFRFAWFSSGKINLENKRKGRPEIMVDNDEMWVIVEAGTPQIAEVVWYMVQSTSKLTLKICI